MLRIPSSLPNEVAELVTRAIGCCITVHRALGPGLLEGSIGAPFASNWLRRAFPSNANCKSPVRYRDELLCVQRLDIVAAGQIVLEVKSVERVAPVHHAQL